MFSKYLRKKLAEKATKICGTLNDDFKSKDQDKKVIAQVIRLMHANSGHLCGRVKKMATIGDFKEEDHKKYHHYLESLYLSEYIKKSSMVKYTEVYGELSSPILEQDFTQDKIIDTAAFEVLKEIEGRLKTFMDEKALKSSLSLTRIETIQR